MRVIADIASANIIQVEKTPPVDSLRPMNGRFAVPVPEMVALDVQSDSYVLPVDGGDVYSRAMASLLIQFPMYSNIVFNPLLTAADVADFDISAAFTPTGDVTRAMVGRGSGILPLGNAPNSTRILAQNDAVTPARPGLLITDTIDISALTGGLGADEFLVWWKLYQFETTHDVTSAFGATAGQNEPAVRHLVEVDPEPAGFRVHLSHDDGANYIQMNRVDPTDFTTFGTQLRLAFRNTNATQSQYLAAFAIMF